MSHLHPAAVLSIVLCLFLVLVMPLTAWFAILRGQNDVPARWWYAGLALTGVGALAVVLMQRASALMACCLTLAMVLCIASMWLELGRQPLRHRYRLATGGAVFVLATAALDGAGLWQDWGALLFTSTMSGLQLYLLYLLYMVKIRHHSRGLWVVMAGVAVAMSVNVVRAVSIALAGYAEPIFALSVLSIAAVAAVSISEVLMTLGYVVFTLEKTHAHHVADVEQTARAQEQQRLAEAHASSLQAIIEQRDAMIVVNSRFSAVNSMAMYSSTIVHEISQPVQALTSVLDILGLDQNELPPTTQQTLEYARQLVNRIGQTLMALRHLMSAQPALTQSVDVCDTVQEILPILQSEARRRNHQLDWVPEIGSPPMVVQADKVLLERILFNLVTNAFEALEGAGICGNGHVSIRASLRKNYLRDTVVLLVEDNGPGLDPELQMSGIAAFRTTKPDGVGLGLALARLIVETWRGQLHWFNRQELDGQSGTRIEIGLPLG